MRIILKAILYFLFIFLVVESNAQTTVYDTIKVMTYNTLDYGFPSSTSCPTLNTQDKHQYLKTIINYAQPDILGLVKMAAFPSTFSTDTIIAVVLDSTCAGCYKPTNYSVLSGYNKTNMLYYKKSKFGLISSIPIYFADNNISDIKIHKLFYKDTNLVHTHDTAFLSIILVHLKSGGSSATSRATEIAGAMTWLNTNVTTLGNYIFMGDFNTQGASEACYQSLINSPHLPTLFFDPVNQAGEWESNPFTFPNYLTQSTRLNDPGDCGATGGMNDRFDHILISEPILYALKSIQYVPNSYTTIGQDGQHTLTAINQSPTNFTVPADVLLALYYMSSHLPVSLKLAIKLSSTFSIKDNNVFNDDINLFPNPFNDFIIIKMKSHNNKIKKAEIVNTLGATVKEYIFNKNNVGEELKLDVKNLYKGIYFIKMIDLEGNISSIKKIVKN